MKFFPKRNFSHNLNKFHSISNFKIVASNGKFDKLNQDINNRNLKYYQTSTEYLKIKHNFKTQGLPIKTDISLLPKKRQLRLKLLDNAIMKINGTKINIPKEIKSATLSPKARIPWKKGYRLNATNEKGDTAFCYNDSKNYQLNKNEGKYEELNFSSFQNKYKTKLNTLKENKQFSQSKYFQILGRMLEDIICLVPQIEEVLKEYLKIFYSLTQSLFIPDCIVDFSKLFNTGKNLISETKVSPFRLQNKINYADKNENFIKKFKSESKKILNMHKKSEAGPFETSSTKQKESFIKNPEAGTENFNLKKVVSQKRFTSKEIPRLSLNQISKNSMDFNSEFMSHFNEFSDSWRELSKQLK